MSKHRNLIILVGCGIFAIALVWALLPPRQDEHSYQGYTLSQLLEDISQGQGALKDDRVRAIGTNAIPACLKWIRYEGEGPLVHSIARLLDRFSPNLGSQLLGAPWRRSNRVLVVFQILGPQARPAIPELTRLARTAIPAREDGSQPGRAGRCIHCLGFIGPEAIPSLISLVTNSPPLTRSSAIWKLADFGTNAVAAVPALRLALTHTHPYVTHAAGKALAKIAPEVLTNTASQPPSQVSPLQDCAPGFPSLCVCFPGSAPCDLFPGCFDFGTPWLSTEWSWTDSWYIPSHEEALAPYRQGCQSGTVQLPRRVWAPGTVLSKQDPSEIEPPTARGIERPPP